MFLILLTLFLTGTVVVLTTVVQYFGVDWRDVITEPEMKRYELLAKRAMEHNDKPSINLHAVSSPSTAQAQDEGSGAGDPNNKPVHHLPQPTSGVVDVQSANSEDSSPIAYAAAKDLDRLVEDLARRAPASNADPQPRIPKIIHQTWKTDVLPERWDNVRKACMEMHPD